MKDYYSTLGVSRDATEGDMKKAFRKKAMDYHPDRNKENPKAEEKFKEVNEAYAVLSDKNKRSQYDRSGIGVWWQFLIIFIAVMILRWAWNTSKSKNFDVNFFLLH